MKKSSSDNLRIMFIAMYRWKIKPDREEGWRRITEEIYRKHRSLGSRLHRAEDDTWVAYAQWPDKKNWEARKESLEDTEAIVMLRESIEISYSEIYMEVVDDLLQSCPFESSVTDMTD